MRRGLLCWLSYVALATPAVANETVTYTYDALGRLVMTSIANGPNAGQSIATVYDPAGNRSGAAVGGAYVPPANVSVFSISNPPAVDEGTPVAFVITRSGVASSSLSVHYATATGTAGAGDFTATSGTLTFQPWQTGLVVNVPTTIDGLGEAAEQFTMTLSAPSSGATISGATATATINASSATNQAPVANTDTGTVGQCKSVTLNVVANDTDPDGNLPLSVASVGSPTRGTATIVGTTSVQYHSSGSVGTESFGYVVQDSLGATDGGTIQINVTSGTGCQ